MSEKMPEKVDSFNEAYFVQHSETIWPPQRGFIGERKAWLMGARHAWRKADGDLAAPATARIAELEAEIAGLKADYASIREISQRRGLEAKGLRSQLAAAVEALSHVVQAPVNLHNGVGACITAAVQSFAREALATLQPGQQEGKDGGLSKEEAKKHREAISSFFSREKPTEGSQE